MEAHLNALSLENHRDGVYFQAFFKKSILIPDKTHNDSCHTNESLTPISYEPICASYLITGVYVSI